jgi:hypothetical protein
MKTNKEIEEKVLVMSEYCNKFSSFHFSVYYRVDSAELSSVAVPTGMHKQQAKQTVDTWTSPSQSIRVN